jgi:AcrR family transcriptional regulator
MESRDLRVQSNVKDESLVEKRRQQILHAAIQLFREKGFHRATTREIATAAGFSIGTLYEYVRTKEDVLYLICDSIFIKVMEVFDSLPYQDVMLDQLEKSIAAYFMLVDSMHNEFIIMYQETKSLPNDAKRYVIKRELEMVGFFEQILHSCIDVGELQIARNEVFAAANQILIIGQSWAFRNWALQQRFTLEEFITLQTELFMTGLLRNKK